MVEHEVEAVVHLAGFKYAGVSVHRPLHTYEQNVQGTVSLLQAMHESDVDKIVFSSSAAVYGTPDVDTVTEPTPTAPESPYGETKLIGEWLMRSTPRERTRCTTRRCATSTSSARRRPSSTTRARTTCSRSSSRRCSRGVRRASTATTTRRLTAPAYATTSTSPTSPTRTSWQRRSCSPAASWSPVYNLGSGDGVSVREIMTAVADATGIAFEPEIGTRREGDPARIVASGELAARDLGLGDASYGRRHGQQRLAGPQRQRLSGAATLLVE